MRQETILSLRNISKSFPGVRALDAVRLDFFRGEVHGICGENGAGKSTLMKVLCGVYSLDEGEIFIRGEKANIHGPLDSLNRGMSIIFQEFNLINALSIAENIFMGRLSNARGSWVDWKAINKRASELLRQLGCEIDPAKLVKTLSVAEKQMVEIAKALSYDAQIIIMDEPSATLTSREVEKLMQIVQGLREKGVTVIYISHKLEEIQHICDRVTVMRDGKVIATYEIGEVTRDRIIEDMVGRTVDQEYPRRPAAPAEDVPVVLEARGLSRKGVFENISFQLRQGEVLGLAGLVGSGRTEIMRAIFGADKLDAGEVFIRGKRANIRTPDDSIRHGLALLTEDRKAQGLHLLMPVSKNVCCARLKAVSPGGVLNRRREKTVAQDYIRLLNIKTPSTEQKAIYLSGGNQQKVVIAKWLYANCDIMILDEPTRGIDVGAKMEIYLLINELVAAGKSILLISSELPELLAMSDRVLVIYGGRTKGVLEGAEITADNVMATILRDQGGCA